MDRLALGAGVAAAVIYAMLYLAYEVTQGWDIPPMVAVVVGLVVAGATAVSTELALRALTAEASKEV